MLYRWIKQRLTLSSLNYDFKLTANENTFNIKIFHQTNKKNIFKTKRGFKSFSTVAYENRMHVQAALFT